MADISTYLAGALQDHALGVSAFAQPAALWLALHIADPGTTGINEVSGGSYARQEITFAAASPGSGNSDAVDFIGLPESIVTHMSLWDAEAGGNMLFAGACDADIEVEDNGGVSVGVNEFIVQL